MYNSFSTIDRKLYQIILIKDLLFYYERKHSDKNKQKQSDKQNTNTNRKWNPSCCQ